MYIFWPYVCAMLILWWRLYHRRANAISYPPPPIVKHVLAAQNYFSMPKITWKVFRQSRIGGTSFSRIFQLKAPLPLQYHFFTSWKNQVEFAYFSLTRTLKRVGYFRVLLLRSYRRAAATQITRKIALSSENIHLWATAVSDSQSLDTCLLKTEFWAFEFLNVHT